MQMEDTEKSTDEKVEKYKFELEEKQKQVKLEKELNVCSYLKYILYDWLFLRTFISGFEKLR